MDSSVKNHEFRKENKMKHLQSLSFLLLAALLIGTTACGGTDSGPADTDTTASSETTAAPTGLADTVTDGELKALGLDGYEFRIFQRVKSNGWSCADLSSEGENGEVLNDTVWKRNLALEDRFGFTISCGYSADTYAKELATYVLAGDDTYDAALPMGRTAAGFASQGILADLSSLSYLDFDSSVWNKTFNDNLSYNGKLYYAAGSVTINSLKCLRCILFNKDRAAEYKLDDPYAIVRAGKWTLDVFEEMAKTVSADLDGNTVYDLNDLYGYDGQSSVSGLCFYYGSGETMVGMENGLPVVQIGNERSTQVFDRIRKMFGDTTVFKLGADADVAALFASGNALFRCTPVTTAETLRAEKVDFGILPLPKFDEKQEKYYTYTDGWCISPVVVPKNAKNPERSGFVLQAIAEASVDTVVPVYYDACLTAKGLRDEESSEMLDILFANYTLDNIDLYQWGVMYNAVLKAFTGSDGLASLVAANKSALEAAIASTTESLT